MRRTRWLILAAISILLLTVGATYVARVERGRREAPPAPPVLKEGIEGTAEGWHYSHSEGGCPVFEAKAKQFEQVTEPTTFHLEGVAIRLFHQCGKTADEVQSAKASFDAGSGVMASEGDVEITMGVPVEGEGEAPPSGRLLKIASSGIQFDTKTGKASTDALARFHFDRGEGQAVGAEYDPNTKILHLKSQVDLTWRGADKKAAPMHVEAGEATYWEQNGEVALAPWSKLTRDKSHIESTGTAHVTLTNGSIRLVDAPVATGYRDEPGRRIEYSTDELIMNMDENGEPTQVEARNKVRIASITADARTEINAASAVMSFVAKPGGNELGSAVANGQAVIESRPILKPGVQAPDTRVLRAERIVVNMREGGKEVKDISTETPGTIEFLPNRPDQPHRVVNAERLLILYGANNAVESFRASNAKTHTDFPPRKGKPQRQPALTASKELIASFDPKTQQMKNVEQNGDFTYEEGQRKSRADHAALDQTTDLMVLTGSARASDPTGSTAADRIMMNQRTGDVMAEGRVSSTRLPDKKKDANPAMLSGDEPMQARANKMFSSEDNSKIRYEGKAVAWQGANKVEADTIVFDRDEAIMKATGNVVSQFVDKAQKSTGGKPAAKPATAPVFTVVRAPAMVYTDDDRVADYTGGAVMSRPNLTVKARQIKAWLKDSDADSSLDKAVADGAVTIDQAMAGRKRTGTSEHAEYFAADEKIVMTGGQPQMVDSLKGTTKGRELTYFSNKDTLLVNGVEAQRAESLIKRKK